jgi:hypothetical protein
VIDDLNDWSGQKVLWIWTKFPGPPRRTFFGGQKQKSAPGLALIYVSFFSGIQKEVTILSVVLSRSTKKTDKTDDEELVLNK